VPPFVNSSLVAKHSSSSEALSQQTHLPKIFRREAFFLLVTSFAKNFSQKTIFSQISFFRRAFIRLADSGSFVGFPPSPVRLTAAAGGRCS
jgi:hypothetical protein